MMVKCASCGDTVAAYVTRDGPPGTDRWIITGVACRHILNRLVIEVNNYETGQASRAS